MKFDRIHIFMIVCLIAIFCACSPAKQVQKQDANLNALKEQFKADEQRLKAQAVAEWVAQNPCIPASIDLDSLCAAYCAQPSTVNAQEYVAPVRDTVTQYAGISYPIIKRILVPTRDPRTEQVLNDSITALRARLAECNAKAQGKTEAQQPCTIDWWTIKNWFFFIALGQFILILTYIIKRFKK